MITPENLPITPNFDEVEFPYVDDNDWVWFNPEFIVYRWTEMRWNSRNKKYYENLGYEYTKMNDNFLVDIGDLSKGSHVKVIVACPADMEIREAVWKTLLRDKTSKCTFHAHFIDLTGLNVGNLKVIKVSHQSKTGQFFWECQCGCGNIIIVRSAHLTGERTTKSCMRGVCNPNWNPNLTDEEREGKRSFYHEDLNELRIFVYIRDNHTCQSCGKKHARFELHHLKDWTTYPDEILDPDNCITLCIDCHKEFHVDFMGSHHITCTEEDYKDWLNSKNYIIKS